MRFLLTTIWLASGAFLASEASAQAFNTCDVPVDVDSGLVGNPGDAQAIVFSELIEVPRATSLRVHFEEAILRASSFVRVTALFDGNTQELDRTALERWQFSSAFFNGDTVRLELVASGRTEGNRVRVDTVSAGVPGDREVPWLCETPFRRGDVNGDDRLDIADAVAFLSRFFLEPVFRYDCEDAADADDSGELEVTDAVFLLNFLFLRGQALPHPLGECGDDPTEDRLNLCSYPASCV